MQQGVVVAVVTHQNGAQQGLAILADHHAPIVAGLFIVKADVASARGLGMGVADGTHVYTQQFELGAHVGTGESSVSIAVQGGRQCAGHGIAGGHQAENLLLPKCALANGVHMWVRGGAVVVDHDAAALADLQAAGPGQGVLGPNACGEDDQVCLEEGFVAEIHAQTGILALGDRCGGLLGVHLNAQLLDFVA